MERSPDYVRLFGTAKSVRRPSSHDATFRAELNRIWPTIVQSIHGLNRKSCSKTSSSQARPKAVRHTKTRSLNNNMVNAISGAVRYTFTPGPSSSNMSRRSKEPDGFESERERPERSRRRRSEGASQPDSRGGSRGHQ